MAILHSARAMETMVDTGVCYGDKIDGTPSMQLYHLSRLYCALYVNIYTVYTIRTSATFYRIWTYLHNHVRLEPRVSLSFLSRVSH